jgi:hypothetical protein
MGALADALVSKGGYNPIDAANAEKGPRASELAREFLGVSSGSSTSAPTSTNPIDQAQAINQFYIKQNQPAISSLQSSIPEVKSIYENQANYLKSQQAPLEKRYSDLIDSITKSTQLETGREFGKRGLSTESGLYDQTLNNRLNPQISQLGISREQDISSLLNQISGLSGQETTGLRDIQNAIAQLQAGNAPNAVSSAQQAINQAEQSRQFNVGAELQKQQAQSQDLSKNYTSLGEGQTLYNLLTGQPVYTAPKSYKPGGESTGDPLGLLG